jgi:hypothetical protein
MHSELTGNAETETERSLDPGTSTLVRRCSKMREEDEKMKRKCENQMRTIEATIGAAIEAIKAAIKR